MKELGNKFLVSSQLSYVGQTIEHATDRYNGHLETSIYDSMSKKRSWFENIMHKYAEYSGHDTPSEIASHIRDLFEIEVLQVIKAQETNEITQKLGGQAEKFWIGWTHSQFEEFGFNYEEGGRTGRMTFRRIDPILLNDIIEQSLLIPKKDKPWQWVIRQLPLGEVAITKNIKEVYKKYGVNSYMDIRYLKLADRIKLLSEHGYEQWEIGLVLGAQGESPTGSFGTPERSRVSRQLRRWFAELHDNIDFASWQEELISNRMKALIERGYITPSELATHFEGMNTDEVFNFLSNHLSEYLKQILISLYRKGYVSASQMASQLQFSAGYSKIYAFLTKIDIDFTALKQEAGLLPDSFIFSFEKKAATRLIKNSLDEKDLLIKLGYKEVYSLSNHEVRNIINTLFDGMSYKKAKNFYSSRIL